MLSAHFVPTRSRIARLAPAALLLGFLPLAARAQTTVYSQPAVYPAGTALSSWTSSSSTAFVTSDNFSLASAARLTGLTWQGFTFITNGGTQGVEPTTFTIEFRADSAGIPGAVLDTETVTPTRTLAGVDDFFGPGTHNSIYDYTASLSGAYTAPAAAPLWVSVIGDTTSPNFWTWTEGTGGDGSCYQEVSDPNDGSSTVRPGDRAFSLTTSPVPEASTTVSLGLLLAFGLGGVVAAKRKKAGQAAG